MGTGEASTLRGQNKRETLLLIVSTNKSIRTLEKLRLEIERITFELDHHQKQLASIDKPATVALYAAEQGCYLVREMMSRALAIQFNRGGNI
jgi:c-di-AMP phosphodiesterase-like protein